MMQNEAKRGEVAKNGEIDEQMIRWPIFKIEKSEEKIVE